MTRFSLSTTTFAILFLLSLSLITGCQDHQKPGFPPTGGGTESGIGPAADGHVVSNGGNFPTALFQQGRLHAIRALSSLSPQDEKSFPSGFLFPGEFDWLLLNYKKVSKDIASVEHRFVPTLPLTECSKHSCACAPPSHPTWILLLDGGCLNYSRISQVGELLLHESLHHFFKSDELKVSRLAAAVYAVWTNRNEREPGHWTQMSPTPRKVSRDALAVWDGQEMVVPNDINKVLRYDPVWNNWKEQVPRGSAPIADQLGLLVSGSWNPLVYGKVAPSIFSIAEGVGLFQPSYNVTNGGTGVFLDNRGIWWWMSQKQSIPWRENPVVTAVGNELIVWGGNSDPKGEKWSNAGWRYRGATNLWAPMSPYPFGTCPVLPAGSYSVVSTGEEMIFWNSFDTCPSAIYSPQTDSWRRIGLKPGFAPRYRHHFSAVWTASGLLVFGGYLATPHLSAASSGEEESFQASGAIYDLKQDQWKLINSDVGPIAPKYLEAIPVVWTGTHAVFRAERLYFYQPWANRWSLSDAPVDPVFRSSQLIWTGTELIVWDPDGGFVYHP